VTVTAPPWPPDSVEWAEPEALIAEARQRARRRRHIYAAAIAVLALLATSTTTAPRRRDTRSFLAHRRSHAIGLAARALDGSQ
jgi:hypothetical protein